MNKTNTNFFRSILLASLLLATYMSQAQMYPFKSAERVISFPIPDSTYVLARAIDEKYLLTSYSIPVASYGNFLKTTQGTTATEYVRIGGINHVSDFKVLHDWLFFCGQDNNNTGFVAWTRLDEFFDPLTNNIEISVLPNISDVKKIDAYQDGQYKYAIVAIGDNQQFIYTGVLCDDYYVYTSPFPLSDVVATDNHIVVLGKISLGSLALFTHPKVNIQNYFGMSYTHNQARFENFLIERLFEDNVLVSYTDRPNDYQAQFVRIDTRTLQPIAQQSLLKVGKPNPKEMVFNPADSTVLYLSHAVENKDMIATIKPYLNYSYPSDVVIPNMCKWGHETFNSLTNYRNDYLSAAGIDTAYNNLYWFDYRRETNQGSCFRTIQEKVIMSNTFVPASQQSYWGNQTLPRQVQTKQIQHFSLQYNIICND